MKKIACVCVLLICVAVQVFAVSEYYFVYFPDSSTTEKYSAYFIREKNPVHILLHNSRFYGFVVMPKEKSGNLLIIRTTPHENWRNTHDVNSVQEIKQSSLDKTWGYDKTTYWWTVEGYIEDENGFRCKLITNDF